MSRSCVESFLTHHEELSRLVKYGLAGLACSSLEAITMGSFNRTLFVRTIVNNARTSAALACCTASIKHGKQIAQGISKLNAVKQKNEITWTPRFLWRNRVQEKLPDVKNRFINNLIKTVGYAALAAALIPR